MLDGSTHDATEDHRGVPERPLGRRGRYPQHGEQEDVRAEEQQLLVVRVRVSAHLLGFSAILLAVTFGLALALLAISPYVLAEVVWPRTFETTARKDSIDYEFASAEYAAEF